MPSDVELLSQAGFSNEDVENWTAAQRATLATAGFSEPEIDNHLGTVHVPAEIPKPFLERLANGTAVGRVLGRLGERFGEAFGPTPLGLSDESASWLREMGVFRRPKPGLEDPIRFLNEALIYPTTQVLDATSRLPAAALWGASGAAGQALEELGSSRANAMKFSRDLDSILTLVFMRSGAEAPVTRLAVHPNGAVFDEPLGTLPRAQDFRTAAKDIAGDAADLSTQEKLLQVWTDHGIHPAEIAEDVRRDPTIAQAVVSKDVDVFRADLNTHLDEQTAAGSAEHHKPQAARTPSEEQNHPESISATESAPSGLRTAEGAATTKPETPHAPEADSRSTKQTSTSFPKFESYRYHQ
jgi:hypothetical protein